MKYLAYKKKIHLSLNISFFYPSIGAIAIPRRGNEKRKTYLPIIFFSPPISKPILLQRPILNPIFENGPRKFDVFLGGGPDRRKPIFTPIFNPIFDLMAVSLAVPIAATLNCGGCDVTLGAAFAADFARFPADCFA